MQEEQEGTELASFHVKRKFRRDVIHVSEIVQKVVNTTFSKLILKMSLQGPALLAFAQKEEVDGSSDTIYRYLADAGFEPDEVRNWGKIGSLIEALKMDDGEPCHGCTLDDNFIKFIESLPPGNTPRPQIRHQMQRTPTI